MWISVLRLLPLPGSGRALYARKVQEKLRLPVKEHFIWFLISMCHEVTDEPSQRNGIDIRTRRRSVLSVV